jgi:antitoxin component YwqK of YwqJK toxin-antitoxin module
MQLSTKVNLNRVYVGIVALALCLAAVLLSRAPRSRLPKPPSETLRRDLVQTDGRWYRRGQTNLFTGIMADYYPGGGWLSRCEISNGLAEGLAETWYTNGQIQVREHFKNGISDGLRERWHENGARLSQATISSGKVNGTFQSWHENGQLSEQIEMKVGHADGIAFAWYPSGFLKAETTVHDGQVLDRKSWKDGERAGGGSP